MSENIRYDVKYEKISSNGYLVTIKNKENLMTKHFYTQSLLPNSQRDIRKIFFGYKDYDFIIINNPPPRATGNTAKNTSNNTTKNISSNTTKNISSNIAKNTSNNIANNTSNNTEKDTEKDTEKNTSDKIIEFLVNVFAALFCTVFIIGYIGLVILYLCVCVRSFQSLYEDFNFIEIVKQSGFVYALFDAIFPQGILWFTIVCVGAHFLHLPQLLGLPDICDDNGGRCYAEEDDDELPSNKIIKGLAIYYGIKKFFGEDTEYYD